MSLWLFLVLVYLTLALLALAILGLAILALANLTLAILTLGILSRHPAGRSINTLSQAVGAVCAASVFSSTSALRLEASDCVNVVGQSANTSVVHYFSGAAGAEIFVALTC